MFDTHRVDTGVRRFSRTHFCVSSSETSLARIVATRNKQPNCGVDPVRIVLSDKTMRISKHGRGKKSIVAPMSDDEDTSSVHHHQSSAYPSRHQSRGVSFTTARGKIWLILVINLFIITTFIFLSSSRFPSEYGEGAVNEVLEQDQTHAGLVNKNSEQTLSLAATQSAVTEEPQQHVQETSHPGGYTKLTSTDLPEILDKEVDIPDAAESETVSEVLSDILVNPSELPVEPQEQESQLSLPSKTQQAEKSATTPDVNVPVDQTVATTTTPPAPASTGPVRRSPAEIADIISRMKESQNPTTETLQPLPELPVEAEYTSNVATALPQSTDNKRTAVEAKASLENLAVWLTSDSGVEVENLAVCLASLGDDVTACRVISWINQIDSTAFRPASLQQKPVWIPIVPDTHNQLPTVYFSCPLVTDALRVHETMTLFFVLSPAQVEAGVSYTGQKFFGNSPYGQFALHGGKPSFFANNGLVESAQRVPMGQFSLLVYRVHQGFVQIKVNGESWGGELPVEGGSDERRIRFTVNDVVSLGNSKGGCDTNAFQGRIAEVLVYDDVLDDAKVKEVERYLHGKWWGSKPLPEAASSAHPVRDTNLASKSPHNVDHFPTLTPANPSNGRVEGLSDSKQTPSVVKTQPSPTRKPLTSNVKDTPLEPTATEPEDTTPVLKFDPRINIFEWIPPPTSDSAKATRWTSTVKEKVNYIRNFQLGGEVLRTLIRQHRDELLALREELFG